jgi:hypothetical protein
MASVATEILAWRLILSLAGTGSTFVYMFAGSYSNFPALEYRVVKARGSRIVFLNLGSDLRPPYMDGPVVHADPSATELLELTQQRWRRARVQEAYGDLIVAAPSLGHFFTRPFVTWFVVGLPQRRVAQSVVTPQRQRGSLRVLHAPSDRAVKGTEVVRQAVRDCQGSGIPIDYVELDQVSHDVVLAEIAGATLLIDQVYSDLPMAGIGAEGAALGVPTLVAGYFSPQAASAIPEELLPPAMFVLPEELTSTLRRLLTDDDARARLGDEGRQFVRDEWEPRAAARRLLACLTSGVPTEWEVEPQTITYALGCGAPEELVVRSIQLLVDEYGPSALHLQHHPEVEEAVLRQGMR